MASRSPPCGATLGAVTHVVFSAGDRSGRILTVSHDGVWEAFPNPQESASIA